MAKNTYIIIGKIGSAYGVQGWLKIQSFTEHGGDILNYSPWYLSPDQQSWTAYEIADSKVHGKGFIAKIAGLNSPETARTLTGQAIAVRREQLPALKQDEFYWSDLIGLTVIDQHQRILGQVKYLLETGSNDVLVVQGTKQVAIPYLPNEVIIKVDLKQRVIYVDWKE